MRFAAARATTRLPGRRCFGRDQNGAVVPLFAILLAVFVGSIGLAIDSSRVARFKSQIAAAADAANLAAARAAANLEQKKPTAPQSEIIAEAEEVGKAFFASNTSGIDHIRFDLFDLKVVRQDSQWKSKISYSARLATTAGVMLGQPQMRFDGTPEVAVTPGFPVLDIAMCVDSTGSMSGTLDAVKANALGFFDNLNAELKVRGIAPFPLVRVRMMYFKDFGDGGGRSDPDPLLASSFFQLPAEASNFSAFVSPQVANGGWDWAESGQECLNEAISSSWLKVGDKPAGFADSVTDVYPLVVVWTDASAHRLNYPNSIANPIYPPPGVMPRTDADFLAKWNDPAVIDQNNKQLLFFGDPAQVSQEFDGGPSGWDQVMTWPKFTLGGTVTEANASMIEFLATGIATNARGLHLTN